MRFLGLLLVSFSFAVLYAERNVSFSEKVTTVENAGEAKQRAAMDNHQANYAWAQLMSNEDEEERRKKMRDSFQQNSAATTRSMLAYENTKRPKKSALKETKNKKEAQPVGTSGAAPLSPHAAYGHVAQDSPLYWRSVTKQVQSRENPLYTDDFEKRFFAAEEGVDWAHGLFNVDLAERKERQNKQKDPYRGWVSSKPSIRWKLEDLPVHPDTGAPTSANNWSRDNERRRATVVANWEKEYGKIEGVEKGKNNLSRSPSQGSLESMDSGISMSADSGETISPTPLSLQERARIRIKREKDKLDGIRR